MSRRSKSRSLWRSIFTFGAALVWSLVPVQVMADAGGNESDNGSVPLLVKSRVPLTPEVVAAISVHVARVSFVWPEIDAMAVKASPSKIADLIADPFVEVVESDLQAGVTNDDPALTAGAPEASQEVVPLLTSSSPIQTWNQDLADTPGSAYTGTGVTVAVVDSGLPQNWQEFLPADCVDLEHAAGFGAEGWGDFRNPVNAVRGVGGHIGLFPHGLAVSSVIVGFPSDSGPVDGAWFFENVPESDASSVYVAFFSGRESLSAPPASLIDVLAPGSWVFGEWLIGHGLFGRSGRFLRARG